MCPKCVHTQNVALLKSIINIVWYQTLQNANKRRNRTFDVFLLIVREVIRTFVTVCQLSGVAGTVTVVECLNMYLYPVVKK